LKICVAQKQSLPCEELPQNNSDGENIRASVDVLSHRRLGREVRKFSFDDSGLALFELRIGLCQAEIHDFYLAELRDEHVRRRHVAVHDVHRLAVRVGDFVRVREPFANLRANPNCRGHWKFVSLFFQRLVDGFEVRAVDELHDDEVRVVADADVEHLHAIRM